METTRSLGYCTLLKFGMFACMLFLFRDPKGKGNNAEFKKLGPAQQTICCQV